MPDDTTTARSPGHVPREEPEFPNIAKMKAFDRQQHIQKALEAGLTREEAERHADDELRRWSPRAIEEPRDEGA